MATIADLFAAGLSCGDLENRRSGLGDDFNACRRVDCYMRHEKLKRSQCGTRCVIRLRDFSAAKRALSCR